MRRVHVSRQRSEQPLRLERDVEGLREDQCSGAAQGGNVVRGAEDDPNRAAWMVESLVSGHLLAFLASLDLPGRVTLAPRGTPDRGARRRAARARPRTRPMTVVCDELSRRSPHRGPARRESGSMVAPPPPTTRSPQRFTIPPRLLDQIGAAVDQCGRQVVARRMQHRAALGAVHELSTGLLLIHAVPKDGRQPLTRSTFRFHSLAGRPDPLPPVVS
jgi:hypothetical protein